ncbi:hypothetical protein J6590_028947 [Homalodisca vitripennis]|nr:hypothetical protein J6590_028947 [Homalodisca vitripennis]
MFESDSTEALKLEIKEETYLHSERIRKEVSQHETETGEIASPCPGGQEYCESADDYPTLSMIEDCRSLRGIVLDGGRRDKIKILLKKQPKFILDHFNIERDNQHRDFGPYSPAPGPGSGSGSSDEDVDVDAIPTTPMRVVDWPLCSSMGQNFKLEHAWKDVEATENKQT